MLKTQEFTRWSTLLMRCVQYVVVQKVLSSNGLLAFGLNGGMFKTRQLRHDDTQERNSS